MKTERKVSRETAHTRQRWLLPKSLAVFVALATCSPTSAVETLKPTEIGKLLKDGGYVVYIRHASTEKDYADQVAAVTGNCSTQRTLSEKGWREAELIGFSFRHLNIPIGAIYSSEYCRAWQTARLAFGSPVKLPALNFEPSETYSPEQITAMKDRLKPLLSKAPPKGTNTVIIGHDDPFEATTGIYPEPQGVAYVVKPKSTVGFEVLGHISPDQWSIALKGM